jgi:hypothetical protein
VRNFDVTIVDTDGREYHVDMSGLKAGSVWNQVRATLKRGYQVIAVKES